MIEMPAHFRTDTIASRVVVLALLFVALILFLLSIVMLQLDTLVGVRAYVNAEGLWSKAQKEAAFNLERYTHTGAEPEYQEYLRWIQIPRGHRRARFELERDAPDMDAVRADFLLSSNDPADVDAMARVFLRFRQAPRLEELFRHWTATDKLIDDLEALAATIHSEVVAGRATPQQLAFRREQVKRITLALNEHEEAFSTDLGIASRWANGWALAVVFGAGGLFLAVGVGVSWSVAARIRATERRLFDSEQKFRTITSAAQDAVIMLDDSGAITFWNQAARKIFGYDPEEVMGKPLHPLLVPDRFRPEYEKGLDHFRATGEGAAVGNTLELTAIRKTGVEFPVELSVSAVQAEGRWNAVGILRDISDRKRIEAQFRQLNEALERKVDERTQQLLVAQDELVRREKLAVLGLVAGSVGHELRNPLGVINNAVYFLKTVLADADEGVREYLDIIKGEVGDAERIVSDLLDAVRTKPPRTEATPVAELVERTLRQCALPASVVVRLDLPPGLAPVAVDAQQIRQVLRNLLTNGADAMPEGGPLLITARERNGTVAVSITDHGSGIAPEHQAKLFQPLFTTKARGIGLGLVVVKNLTEANGGQVAVESEPGRGATFTVTLPVADDPALHAAG